MEKREIIEKFYEAFKAKDAETMVGFYHDKIQFTDPAFGALNGEDARNMWRMLLSRNTGLQLEFENVLANEYEGSANWKATYIFSQTGRKIVNKVASKFEFLDDKIVKHTDVFDLWRWSQQAFGWKGYLLGWTSFMQNKIQGQCKLLLSKYSKK